MLWTPETQGKWQDLNYVHNGNQNLIIHGIIIHFLHLQSEIEKMNENFIVGKTKKGKLFKTERISQDFSMTLLKLLPQAFACIL